MKFKYYHSFLIAFGCLLAAIYDLCGKGDKVLGITCAIAALGFAVINVYAGIKLMPHKRKKQ